jgi:tRNA A-37 threonylcarbamoyl transferase component Bud32/tetratricopeptide (TPR) repeat protein
MKNIGKYEIITILGKGAMGIVYKARDPHINREVAIKTIRFDLVSEDSENEEIMQRFMREAQAAGKLSHPNIITIYDVGREESVTYIVMQYIEGQSLQKMISSSDKFSTPEVIDLMCQICNALDYAHKNGIVHRDMKPGNILLDKERKPYICDFGVARVETSTLTQSGTAVGTPSYMSPEQVMGKKVDKRSDIFSLGCILYEILTGRRPFEAESITTVIYKIINEEPLPLIEVKKGLPVGFEQIITKALAKDPIDRYQSCAELAADLRAIHAMADKTIAITMAKEQLPRVEVRKKRRLGPALIAALVTVFVLAVAGALYVFKTPGKIPFFSGGGQKAKVEKSPTASQPGALVAGSVEDKLNKAKESFDKGDYSQAAELAEEILAADAGNLAAKELLTKAQSNINTALTAQVPAKEEPKAAKTSTSVKPKETVPAPTEKKTVEAQPNSTTTSPLKTVVPGSIEDKLNRAKENLEKKNYAETIRLAKEILAVEPGNLQAQEYRDKGEVKLKEAALIAQTLKDGISFYDNEDYEQCLHKMEEVLKLDKVNPDAQKYKDLADNAIYEQKAKEEIKQVIEHQRKAEEAKDLLLILSDFGSDALRKSKRDYGTFLINNYDRIRWSSPSDILPKFKDRNHAEVSFSYISTAVYKKSGSKGTVFDGVKVWTMEKQGNEWKIIKEEIKEGKK